MLQIHIITIFPDMFSAPFAESIIRRAIDTGKVAVTVHNLRDWTEDVHKTIDDRPFGGGPGMVMMLEPLYKAITEISAGLETKPVVLITGAKGEQFTQQDARTYSKEQAIIIVCGHYEGIDQRVIDHLADREISVGPYVLTGGELPAMVITDAIVRLLPGVLGNQESLSQESHDSEGFLEAPHYTRPAVFTSADGEEWKVPDVLLSGNHKLIEEWRKNTKTTKTVLQ